MNRPLEPAPNRAALHDLLQAGPLLADGGTGSCLIDRGADATACLEALNRDQPELVAAVHADFVAAGAQIVTTNTFGANRFKLAAQCPSGQTPGDLVLDLNQRGVALARKTGALVAGSVGPLGVHLAPYGRVSTAEAFEAYAQQIAALAEAGADFIAIETHSDLGGAQQALLAARDVCDLAVFVTTTFTRDDRTLLGSTADTVARQLLEWGADAIGVNCSQGPAQVLRLIQTMQDAAPSALLLARPNAGGPQRVGGRILYPATAEYFAQHAIALRQAGAAIIGGCCGTDPSHIAAMASALARPPVPTPMTATTPAPRAPQPHTSPTPRTGLAQSLADGKFVITVEMDPPRSISAARMLAAADTLADAGADTIDVADSPMARMRMSPWAACRLIQEHTGLETVLHFPTRGRNILRIQGDLLAAHALGLRNVFVVMGDPTEIGDYPSATSNVDVVSTGLISLIAQSLNKGSDQAGSSIGEPTNFTIGCAVNLDPADLAKECKLLARKIACGADFALTQPVFDPAVVARFRSAFQQAHGALELPLLVGVLPLVSVRHALFLDNEVPGINIPPALLARLERAADVAAEGVRILSDMAAELAQTAQGLYVIPQFDRYDIAAEIVEAARRFGPPQLPAAAATELQS